MSKRDIVNELHRPSFKKFPRRRVIVNGINDLWQADLVEMGAYASSNKGYRYLLTVIDTFSKYGWGEAVKTKNAQDVTKAMEKILMSGRGTPKNLQTDNGNEFYNKQFTELMRRFKINHYSTFSVLKASIVERFNRTLKELMWREFSFNGKYAWIQMYKNLIEIYNNRKHRTIKMKPNDVNASNEKHLLATVYNHRKVFLNKNLREGEYVRISKYKHVFEKGYTPNWTTEIFRIRNVRNTFPTTYLLEDLKGTPIQGGFYAEEIKKTLFPHTYLVEKILRRKGDRVLVRWLGFSKSEDSWVHKNEIL